MTLVYNYIVDEGSHDQYQYGMALLQEGMPLRAAVALYPLAREHPENRMVQEALGRSFYLGGLYGLAVQSLSQVIDQCPVEDYSHYLLAKSYEKVGWSHLAGRHYRLARALAPKNPHYSLALDLYLWQFSAGRRNWHSRPEDPTDLD
jgi:Flp pilus assembly protein TadD